MQINSTETKVCFDAAKTTTIGTEHENFASYCKNKQITRFVEHGAIMSTYF